MMTLVKTNETQLRFSVKDFAPAWGAVVMGTGVISSSFSMLVRQGVVPELSQTIATIFFFITLLVAIPILGITIWRWTRYPKAVHADLKNPIKGAMSATFAGSFLVLGLIFGRSGMVLLGEPLATSFVYFFTAIGTALTVYIGMMFMSDLFARGATETPMITGAWFIPPVVTVVVPLALVPIITSDSAFHMDLYWTSWGMLGVGSLLYVIIAATIFYRSATHQLPPQALAPTLVIGMGPPGLIALDFMLLQEVAANQGIATADVSSLVNAIAMSLWSFGLAWGLAALFVIVRGLGRLQFRLSWWGFTFPLGAWVVSGLALGFEVHSLIVTVPSLLGLLILVVVWAVVVVKTLIGVKDNTIWE